MDKPTKLIVDCSTGEQTVVELTDEEIAQLEADRVSAAAEADKAAAKASALAKLAALGLTEDEAKAIAG
jgi:hypothetical protein